jgi:hypothetical protein
MIEVAEDAVEAVQERDALVEQVDQQQLDNKPDSEGDHGTSSKDSKNVSAPKGISTPLNTIGYVSAQPSGSHQNA